MTTKKDSELNAILKAFEGVSWFKDEFGLLNKAYRKSDHVAPKVLYNLEWGGPTRPSTIYKPAADTAVKGNTKKVGFANVDDVDSKEDSSRGSTSQSSLTSSGLISTIECQGPLGRQQLLHL